MRDSEQPFVVQGALARLMPGFARSLAFGPGQLGSRGAAGIILFSAAADIATLDLFSGFWLDEGANLDWLADFLRSPDMDRTIESLVMEEAFEVPEGEEEVAEYYSKADLTTLGSDVIDEY